MITRAVHPVADLFPMLADEELAELAEDIKQRGLLQPIVLDTDGRVLDGRNRLAACELAGVDPDFTIYGGNDPDGYALAVNGQRRSMTKSQKALVAAELLLSKNYGDQRAAARALGVSDALVSQALQITKWARDLRDQIMVTGSGFADAREVAAKRQEAKEITESKRARLRTHAQDLAALVDEGRMDIDDAIAALDARELKARQEADARAVEQRQRAEEEAAHAKRVSETLRMAINTLIKAFGTPELRKQAAATYVDAEHGSEINQNIDAKHLRTAAEVCNNLAEQWGGTDE